MNQKIILAVIILFTSCTAAKVSVPDAFKAEAVSMPVKGLQGWQINQRINFGDYNTSKIKRGWDFTGSVQYTKFSIRPEELLLKVFNINTDKGINVQRNKFQYTVDDGKLMTEIYATEKFREDQLVYKSNNPFIGNVSATKKYEYAFNAAIVPLNLEDKDPWSVVMINRYDREKDTARKLFDRPFIEEEGYATNGKESIAIRSLRLDNVTTASGRQTKVFGGPMLSGYELRWDDGVVAVIDILDNRIWMHKDLDANDKIILSSIASAIMLKRMQDVQKDRDENFD